MVIINAFLNVFQNVSKWRSLIKFTTQTAGAIYDHVCLLRLIDLCSNYCPCSNLGIYNNIIIIKIPFIEIR